MTVDSSRAKPVAKIDAPARRMERLAAEFEDELRCFIEVKSRGGTENLHDAMAFALGADIDDPAQRGKRLRPVLCLLTADSLGADRDLAMPFAMAIELMHNFALVHDDIEDGDVMRRGRDAVWVRYGQPHAINIGDYLLVNTVEVLTNWGPPTLSPATRLELLRLITSALDHTHVGQALDMNYRGRRGLTVEEYLRIVREKTGYYLAAPIQGGAIVAGAARETLETIAQMAQFLGPMFQIIDDIIDLTDGKGREAIGSDIREGKRSYLVAHVSERGSPAERDRLFDILDRPRSETSPEEVEEARAIFDRTGAIEAGRGFCRDLHDQSRQLLARLPESLGRPLGEVFERLVERNH